MCSYTAVLNELISLHATAGSVPLSHPHCAQVHTEHPAKVWYTSALRCDNSKVIQFLVVG